MCSPNVPYQRVYTYNQVIVCSFTPPSALPVPLEAMGFGDTHHMFADTQHSRATVIHTTIFADTQHSRGETGVMLSDLLNHFP